MQVNVYSFVISNSSINLYFQFRKFSFFILCWHSCNWIFLNSNYWSFIFDTELLILQFVGLDRRQYVLSRPTWALLHIISVHWVSWIFSWMEISDAIICRFSLWLKWPWDSSLIICKIIWCNIIVGHFVITWDAGGSQSSLITKWSPTLLLRLWNSTNCSCAVHGDLAFTVIAKIGRRFIIQIAIILCQSCILLPSANDWMS